MPLCIPKSTIEKVKKALKSGDLPLSRLYEMDSKEMNAFFASYVGESLAPRVSAVFEEAIISSNKKAFANVIKRTFTPKQQTDLLGKVEKIDKLLTDKDIGAFKENFVSRKLGIEVTEAETQKLITMTKMVRDKLTAFDEKTLTWSSKKAQGEYGATRLAFEKYVNDLKAPTLPLKEVVKGKISEIKANIKEDVFKGVKGTLSDTLLTIADTSVSLVGSVDNSFIGRQGLTTLFTRPTAWWSGAQNSFVDFYKTIKGKNMEDALWSSIYSEPLYINGELTKSGIFPKFEEAYPTSLPERIPILGRLFKASKVAFEGSALRMRIGTYKILRDIAQKNKVEWSDAQIKDVGKLVNSMTARGYSGEGDRIIRLIMWAPKMLVADWNVLTAHTLGTGLDTAFARKQAGYNMIKVISSMASVMLISNAINKGSAETDPTSSDFGKIKVGNTRFGFTGSKGALIVLASRLIMNSMKSTTTGKITEFGKGYKPTTRFSVLIDFLAGKANPPARAIIDWAKGMNFDFEKPTVLSTLEQTTVPITIQNAIDLKDDNSVQAVLGVILDAVGINTSTYKKK